MNIMSSKVLKLEEVSSYGSESVLGTHWIQLGSFVKISVLRIFLEM